VANNDAKAEISFSWGTSSYAASYILLVNQSGNEVVNKEGTATSYKVTLDKGKTYSWTVTAKNSDGVNTSTTNSFTTPGNPIGNYVPYAAVINFKINSATSMAALSWVGKDEDSVQADLKYTILVTEDGNTIVSLEKIAQMSVSNFIAKLNSIYVIKIDTYDKQGSYSTSVITNTYK